MLEEDKGCSCEDCMFYGESYGSMSNPYDLVGCGCNLTLENFFHKTDLTKKANECDLFIYLIG